jgi:hypothetical protein
MTILQEKPGVKWWNRVPMPDALSEERCKSMPTPCGGTISFRGEIALAELATEEIYG